MHDITEFLSRHEPFDELDQEALERIGNGTEVEYVPAGTLIFPQSASALDHMWVIRRGAVELLDADEVLDELGEGELIGIPSMLTGLPTVFAARASEDTLLYRLRAQDIAPLVSRPEAARFLAREMRHREMLRARAAMATAGRLADRSAHELVRARYVECTADATIGDVARRMVEADVSCAIVRLAEGHGIVTDRDLRARVVAVGRSLEAPVETIMTAPALCVDPDQPASEVSFAMLEHGIRHVPVIDGRGNVLGVVRDVDLLASEESHPFSLRREVAAARSVDEIRSIAARLPQVLIGLGDAAMPGSSISRVHATIADAIVARLVVLTAPTQPPLGVELTWIATGSHGRRELTPASDLDAALTWPSHASSDDEAVIRGIGTAATEALSDLLGLSPDPNGETAASPLFARSLASWRELVSRWSATPSRDKVPIFLSAVLDGRPIGDPSWSAEMVGLMRDARVRDGIAHWLLRLAVDSRLDAGIRPRILEPVRGRGGEVNLKTAIAPIVALARYGGFIADSGLIATGGRLRAAGADGVIREADAALLVEAHEWFSDLRVNCQLAQLRDGVAVSDVVAVQELSTLTRAYMKDAFRLINGVRRRMAERL